MSEDTRTYAHIDIKSLEGSEVEIRGEIVAEAAERYRQKALKRLGEHVSLDGFRKGHVPKNVLVQHLGEPTIMQEAAEIALQDAYPDIVSEHDLKVLGRPQVTITKLAPGNPIGFTVRTAVFPDITLPDYKKIARDINAAHADEKIEATDEDVEKVVLQARKNKWLIDHKDDPDVQKREPKDDLPPLTDDLVKQLGDFADIFDFRVKIRAGILEDKKQRAASKRRGEIGEAIIAQTAATLPRVLIDHELEKILAQFKHDVAAVGMSFDDYLKKAEKSETDLKKKWEIDAKKRAMLQLALNEIARTEEIIAEPGDVVREVERIMKEHPKANESNARMYVATILTNEKVFLFLERL